MVRSVPLEVLLAGGYALFLLLVAALLEWLALRSHRRSERYEVAGFKFHATLDRWECPEGQILHRHDVDHQRRIVRYRAPAQACNTCRIKLQCTDSHTGREIERQVDSWLRTEIGRFHRGISLSLLLLAGLLVAIEAARFRQSAAELILGALFVPIAITAARLLAAFSNSDR